MPAYEAEYRKYLEITKSPIAAAVLILAEAVLTIDFIGAMDREDND